MKNISDYITKFAQETPDKLFLERGKQSLTYEESNRIINEFIEKNLCKIRRSKIGIFCDNQILYVLSLFSVYRSENIAVPLNYRLKVPEIKKMFREGRIDKIIIEKSCISPRIEEYLKELNMVIVLESVEDFLKEHNLSNVKNDKDDFHKELRLILHTSGTTGNPKRVMLSDYNLIENAKGIVASLDMTQKDIGVDVLPLSHSFGNSIINSHLLTGGTIRFASILFPKLVFEMVNGSTMFYGVHSIYSILLKYETAFKESFRNLRLVASAGGALKKQNIKHIKKLCPNLEVCLMYGQTEASARLSYVPIKDLKKGIGTIGIPLNNVEFRIFDENLNELPENSFGEIAVKGPNIMLGYLYDEEATKRKIVNSWMLTGDLGYKREDGFFVLTSRKDDIIKVSGFRVNPKEIELELDSLPYIKESLVFAVHNEELGDEIGVAIILKDGYPEDLKSEILLYCRENMIHYKVPKEIIFLDDFPKTNTGKISRKKNV